MPHWQPRSVSAIYRDKCGEVTAGWRRPSPAGGQRLQTAQHEGWPPLRVFGIVELQLREPAQQRRNRDLRLDPGELRAQTEMDAAAERQRPDIGTGDVQTIRAVRIHRWVAVGGSEQAKHRIALRNLLAAEVVDIF